MKQIFDQSEVLPRCGLAYKRALRRALATGREKEGGLATTSLEFQYLHRKSQCEMLISGGYISNGIIQPLAGLFQCLFTFVLVSALC